MQQANLVSSLLKDFIAVMLSVFRILHNFLLLLSVYADMLSCNVFFKIYMCISVQFNIVTKIITWKNIHACKLNMTNDHMYKQIKIFVVSVKLLLTNSRIYQAFRDWHNPFWGKNTCTDHPLHLCSESPLCFWYLDQDIPCWNIKILRILTSKQPNRPD